MSFSEATTRARREATISRARVCDALSRAIEFTAARQLAHGEIAVHRYGDRALSGEGAPDSSPFATSFALLALEWVDHPLVHGIRERAEAFLLEEREPPGLWRYWSSRNGAVIDPDLDDTCCVSFALRATLGHDTANHEAILANRHASGLFKTWLRPEAADNDVDGVVNANVVLHLGERPETRAARDIVCAAINGDREAQSTSYYVDPLALYHAVARAYAHGATGFSACREAVLRKLASGASADDALSAALRLSTRLCFGEVDGLDEDVRHLLATQRHDGGFERAAFYSGPEPPAPRSVWWGSEELTTALCIEALGRYQARPRSGS